MAPSDEAMQLIVQGMVRIELIEAEATEPFLLAKVQNAELPPSPELNEDDTTELEAHRRAVLALVAEMLELGHGPRAEQIMQTLNTTEDPIELVYLLGSLLQLDTEKEQSLLEANERMEALKLVHEYLQKEVQVLELRNQIASRAHSEMSREQREYMLRQQLKAIQEELGERSPAAADVDELRDDLADVELPEEVRKEADRELDRLERLPPASPDYQMTRTYLELVTELPWSEMTVETIDLNATQAILDEDHFGLSEVKDRILEHLAVLKLNPEAHSPILCFVGPPGVGKTSLGQSIARAVGRKFVRISLGGMHDEAELRGHRRTYIGAMPGRIIQAIRRVGVRNPLIMLDEVEKLGSHFRGDPASALLEILDPAQNGTFRDNYLNLPFDLSRVFFIATSNTLDTVPQPLLDRMETIRISGYTTEEKAEIAKRYLIPNKLQDAGIGAELLTIPDDALKAIITRYTREAGVRQLERAIGRLARKQAVSVARGDGKHVTVAVDDLPELLGSESRRPETARESLPPGVAAGLAWTQAGGDILYVEARLLPGGSGMKVTGQLGEVMRESAEAAHTYIWSHCDELGIDRERFESNGLHIHVPAGAVPKDGPSAGVAMVTALASLYGQVPARSDTAMTGEITLSGQVLPVGGVKEKVLAARAAGIQRVILPAENKADLREIAEPAREDLEFIMVDNVADLLGESVPDLASLVQKLTQ
jgi:ATP-dependent Lon protease